MVALIVDGLVVTLLALIVATVPELMWAALSPVTVPRWLAGATSAIAETVPLLYFTVLWTTTGRTVGGLATGTVVEHRDGHRLSLPHAFARAVIGLALAPLWLVGMVLVLTDGRRRGLHDRVLFTDVRYVTASTPTAPSGSKASAERHD
jgi:uncharacterized RDD family membrane protein YckC